MISWVVDFFFLISLVRLRTNFFRVLDVVVVLVVFWLVVLWLRTTICLYLVRCFIRLWKKSYSECKSVGFLSAVVSNIIVFSLDLVFVFSGVVGWL